MYVAACLIYYYLAYSDLWLMDNGYSYLHVELEMGY